MIKLPSSLHWANCLVLFFTVITSVAFVQSYNDSGQKLDHDELPDFAEQMENITVPIGREARLPCSVSNLGSYRTAWLRLEDSGILTIHHNVITRNYRVGLTHSDNRNFVLNIKAIQESDRGGYLCQINTVPMRSQVVYLDVVVPPDILLNETSSDIIAPEGSDVTLQCHATGNPEPVVRWRREDNVDIPLTSGRNLKRIQVQNVTGNYLNITRVSRIHMGAWLCVASNGVPPSVSRRILLHVHFAPAIWIPNPSLESQVNSDVILNCHIEAYPPSTNYWMTGNDKPIEASEKYAIKVDRRSYKTHLQLVIKNVNKTDFGMYKCLAKNALGTQERQVRLSEASSIFALAKHQRRGHQSTEFNDFRSSNSVNQRAMYSSKGSKLEDKATNGRQVYRVSLSVSLLALLIIAMA